jgi:cyclase
MYRPRIIPVLLLKNNGLVKSIQFKNHKYIGDPINAVRIYNELEADEIIFLDIEATKNGRCVDIQLVKDIGEEANMPFGVGGGINSLSQIEKLIHAGAEKVVICSEAIYRPEFIKEASQEFGSSTIAVCVDVGKSFFGATKLYSHSGSKAHALELESFVKKMEDFGAGELIIQSIVQDGKMSGYDHAISISVAKNISIPVTVLGGAGSMEDINYLHVQHPFNGYAAGSLFVYQGKHRGVLINYPSQEIKVKSTTRSH